LNHIEEAFDKLFGLEGQPLEYIEIDATALLRSEQKNRSDALVLGLQGGVFYDDKPTALPPSAASIQAASGPTAPAPLGLNLGEAAKGPSGGRQARHRAPKAHARQPERTTASHS
jgi:hypothetical protein